MYWPESKFQFTSKSNPKLNPMSHADSISKKGNVHGLVVWERPQDAHEPWPQGRHCRFALLVLADLQRVRLLPGTPALTFIFIIIFFLNFVFFFECFVISSTPQWESWSTWVDKKFVSMSFFLPLSSFPSLFRFVHWKLQFSEFISSSFFLVSFTS